MLVHPQLDTELEYAKHEAALCPPTSAPPHKLSFEMFDSQYDLMKFDIPLK